MPNFQVIFASHLTDLFFSQTLQYFKRFFLIKGTVLPVSSPLFFFCVWQLLFDLFIGSDLFHVSAKD
jgi:hypothetical protein